MLNKTPYEKYREMNSNNSEFNEGLPIPFKQIIEVTERSLIEKAMNINHGNRVQAAKQLGISRSTLIKKLLHYKKVDQQSKPLEQVHEDNC